MRHRYRIERDPDPPIFLSITTKTRDLKGIKEADDLIAKKVKLTPSEVLIRLNETGMDQYEVETPWSSGSIINPKENP